MGESRLQELSDLRVGVHESVDVQVGSDDADNTGSLGNAARAGPRFLAKEARLPVWQSNTRGLVGAPP